MRVYTVHFRPGSLTPDRDTTLVKEGICWPAFLFTFFWALWHRLWLVAALIVAAEIVIEVVLLLTGADPDRAPCPAFSGFASSSRWAPMTGGAPS